MKIYSKLPQVKSSLSHVNNPNQIVLHTNDINAHNISNNKLANGNIDDSMQIYKISGNKSLSPTVASHINIKNINQRNLMNKNASKKSLQNLHVSPGMQQSMSVNNIEKK